MQSAPNSRISRNCGIRKSARHQTTPKYRCQRKCVHIKSRQKRNPRFHPTRIRRKPLTRTCCLQPARTLSVPPRYRNNYHEAPWPKTFLKMLWVGGNARSAGLSFFCVLLLLRLCRICFELVLSFRLFWRPRPLHGRLTRTFSGYPDYTSRPQTAEKTSEEMFAASSSENVSHRHMFCSTPEKSRFQSRVLY